MRFNETQKIEKQSYLRYLFAKHCVSPGNQAQTFNEVIDSVVGVHSARLPTPYVAFQARMKVLKPADVRSATYATNRLIKLRCMRKTLHTVTQELAPIVHLATLELRTAEIHTRLARMGISALTSSRFMQEIEAAISETPLSHLEILSRIKKRLTALKLKLDPQQMAATARLLLKLTWENGHICYLNHAKHWSNEVRFYGSTNLLYPTLGLARSSRIDAVRELVARHIRAFGPVSIKDIVWWSGVRTTEVREALAYLEPNLVTVDLEGVGESLLMDKSSLVEYIKFQKKANTDSWCAFLAYEDPTLKGYFSTRHRYVDASDYELLFNQIGEVRPSVVIDGKVVGIWAWKCIEKRVEVHWFKPLSKAHLKLVDVQKTKLEAFLNETAPN